MVYQRKARYRSSQGIYFHLENERTKARASGLRLDEYVRIKDEEGNMWSGILQDGGEDRAYYYLTDGNGRRMTGTADRASMVFRDHQGHTWKGIVE